MNPKLSLVGAGPGDAELITVKGIRALQSADIVLYDALSAATLLDYVPKHAPTLYVGKRAGRHSYTQEQINDLIVASAFRYGHVVRLKGGDPFVFGRGNEELAAARAFNIPCDVVPGVSSCISVPALQGIPVTTRGVSDSFWVLTGTTRNHELSPDIALAARSEATIIILMGLRKIREIKALFQQAGKGRLPVAIIRDGSTAREKLYTGVVDTLPDEQLPGSGPGVIILGEVVALSPHFAIEKASAFLHAP